jgi:fluoride exporter
LSFLWVGIGGILGAILRYQLSRWIGERFVVSFPLATLLINVTGSLALGMFTHRLAFWFPQFLHQAPLLLGVGFCGAYTTFSTFSYEFTILFREGRFKTAGLYISCSYVFGFLAAAIGLYGLGRG